MYYTQLVSSTYFSATTSADIQQVQQRCCYIQKWEIYNQKTEMTIHLIAMLWHDFSSYINDVHVFIFSGILSYLKPGKGQQRILKVPHPARVKFMDRANLKVHLYYEFIFIC